MDEEALKKRINEIHKIMSLPDFWNDKGEANKVLKELKDLQAKLEGKEAYDDSGVVITIVAGAGGDDAEDFARMLFDMYAKYAQSNGWNVYVLHENKNSMGGFRNVTFEIDGKGVFGKLKKEGGIHRLVRKSPFNANQKRHTSFCLVDVIPIIKDIPKDFEIKQSDLEVSFARSSGPGGQNVNKRDTSVRIKHIPTGIMVHVESERSQDANREKAMSILKSKLYQVLKEKREEELSEFRVGDDVRINWGNQIRSYVLHPYKMVKDHRSGFEAANIEDVLDGDLDEVIASLNRAGDS